MIATTLDPDRIKQAVDLRDLLGQHVELHNEKVGGTEQSGPCPKCGGDDRLHVTADWFFCRQCHPKRGDAIDFVQFLGLAPDFRGACAYLTGGALLPSAPVIKRAPEPKAKALGWRSAAWQAEAWRGLQEAQGRLDASPGEPGRAYLTGRGILPATWQAWGLGYGRAWDGTLKRERLAIVLPWQRDRITALKYRFVDQVDGGLRYTSKAGGECIAFGLGLAGGHEQTLWLLEGEINALSLWQALWAGGCVNFDVVSFGAEHGAINPVITKLAGRYRQVIVWADSDKDPEATAKVMRAIPGAYGLRSPQVDGAKLDANELLRRGLLGDFARAAWAKFDQDPEYCGRVAAALGLEFTAC